MLNLRSLRQLVLSAARSTLPETWQGGGALLRPLACSGVQQQAGFASEAFDDQLDEELLGEGSVGRYQRQGIPIDAPRTLDDYNRLLTQLASRKRAYLMRDVFEEMSLNGIRPNRRSYYTGLIACMRMRKLGDAMYFWEEMQRRGLEPDTAAYTAIISACGRCGQLNQAVEFKREMQAKGVELGRNTYLALLNAFAEAGKLRSARDVFEEMEAAGHPIDEYAFASLMSCYRHLPPRSVPSDADKQLLGLLASARERVHSALVGQGHWNAAVDGKPDSVGLVVYNSLLNSLVALGYHQQASEVFRQLREEEGLQPDSSTYASIIRSHLAQALGTHTQPSGTKLTELIEGRMRGLDLTPFVKQIEEELQAQRSARSSKGAASVEDLIETADVDLSDAEGMEAASAAQQVQQAPGPISSDEEAEGELAAAGMGLEGAEELEAGESTQAEQQPAEAQQQQQQAEQEQAAQRQQQRQQAGASQAPGHVPPELLAKATLRARSRIRFDIMAENINLEEYYKALHTFQEVLDAELQWGPDVAYELIKTSLDLAAALGGGPAQHAEHPEHAKQAQQAKQDLLDVAHTLLEKFEESGLFVDVESGTELMQLSVRRDVGDLSVAHKLWDLMRRGNRFPRTPVAFKYMRALCQREPHKSPERIREVCTTILNDPDRSAANMTMKSEAYRRREVFGGPRLPQRDSGAGERRRRR